MTPKRIDPNTEIGRLRSEEPRTLDLNAIRERFPAFGVSKSINDDVSALCAEVERLVAENAQLHAALDELELVGYVDSAGFLPLPALPVHAEDQIRFFERATPMFARRTQSDAALGEHPA